MLPGMSARTWCAGTASEGLACTCNRFQGPVENAREIVTLRSLRAGMGGAVLDAYGWPDIPTDWEFVLDHEIDAESRAPRRSRVSGLLLELNGQRAAREARLGKVATGAGRETERPSA